MRDAAVLLGLVAVYVPAARLGLSLAFTAEQVTLVWPPAGIALAATLLLGYRTWPAIWLGAFVANAWAHEPLVTAAAIAMGNTLEALAGAWLLRRVAGVGATLEGLRHVVGFIGLGALVSPTIAASVGTASLAATGVHPWTAMPSLWWTWWIGDAIGILIVTPVVLSWAAWLRRPSWQRPGEAVLLVVALVGTTAVAFIGPREWLLHAPPPRFLVFPFIVWSALRFGQRGTTTVTLIAAAVAIWGTLRWAGPVAPGSAEASVLSVDLFVVVLFLGVVAASGLLLASVVSERRLAADAARRREERLQAALDAAGVGTWTYDIPGGQVAWSPMLEAIHGLPPGSFGGTFEAFQRDIHPEDRERVLDAIRRAVESGEPHDVEYRIVRPDGSVRWVHGRGRVVRDGRGRAVAMTGLCTDITERRRADDVLQESEARLRGLIDSAMDAIIVIDEDERITLFNAAAERTFGCRREEVIGTPLERFIPAAARAAHHQHIKRFGETGVTSRAMGGVLTALRADGQEFPMEAAISQSTVAGKKSYKVIIRDVSERLRTEREREQLLARERAARAELEAASRAKDEFLAILGHELRNPLGAISNAIAVLNQLSRDDERTATPREIIARQGRQLARLLDDLLDLARLESGKITLQRRVVDLREIVRRTLAGFRESGRADPHRLGETGEAVFVEGDPVRLEQVLANLVDNALKYSPPASRVSVSVGPEGEEAVLRVRDAGIGIEPERLLRIFDPFYQVATARARSQGGLGLGLTLVRRLVSLHGGTVSASSAGPGQGCEFVVRLPARAGVEAAAPRSMDGGAGAARRVLVIEDHADSREALALLLTLWGHRVEVVEEGRRGLQRLLAAPPDIAIVDIDLPDVDGYTVAREARSCRAAASVYLVALTGYGQPEDRRRARAAGFDTHLVKPVDAEELLRMLDWARAGRRDGDGVPLGEVEPDEVRRLGAR